MQLVSQVKRQLEEPTVSAERLQEVKKVNNQLQEQPIMKDPDEHKMSSEQLQLGCEEEQSKHMKRKKQNHERVLRHQEWVVLA